MDAATIWDQLVQHARVWLNENTWRVIGAALILILGVLLAVFARFLTSLWTRRKRGTSFRRRYLFPPLAFLIVLFLTGVLVLNALGLAGPIVSFIVTVGVALGVLADSFSGFRILLSRPFSVGDVIEIKGEEVVGMVLEISVSGTVLQLSDCTQVTVPNRKLLDKLVINHSLPSGQSRFRLQLTLESKAAIPDLERYIAEILHELPIAQCMQSKGVWLTAIDPESVTFIVELSGALFDEKKIGSDFLKAAQTKFNSAGVGIRSLTVLAAMADKRV